MIITTEVKEWAWALVAALGRIADGIEGVHKDLHQASEERRIISNELSEKRRAAGRLGAKAARKVTEKGDDGRFHPKLDRAKTGQNSGQNSEEPTGQTPGKLRAKPKQTPGKSNRVWAAFGAAYFARYRVNPVRNHVVNSNLCALIDRVGEEDACRVAMFYLSHTDRFYLNAKHPVGLLLKDWQKLHTEMRTGTKTTTGRAARQEAEASIDEAFDNVVMNKGFGAPADDDEERPF